MTNFEFELQKKYTISAINAISSPVKSVINNNKLIIYSQDCKEKTIIIHFISIDEQTSLLEYNTRTISNSEINLMIQEPKLLIKFLNCTHLDNYLVIAVNQSLYYLNKQISEVLFKTVIKELDNDDSSIEIISVENTNDILIYSKTKSKIFYIEYNESKYFERKNCQNFKICRSFLCIWGDNNLTIHDISVIKTSKSFQTVLFEKAGSIENLVVDLNAKYLAIFEKPRSLYLYRLSFSKIIEISHVPIHDEIKEMTVSDIFITMRLKNFRIVTFQIVDEIQDGYLEIIESNTSKRQER